MAHGRLAQLVLMKRRGRRFVESPPRNHAVAITRHAVTRRTKDLITLLAALESFFRDRKRKGIHVIWKHCGRVWSARIPRGPRRGSRAGVGRRAVRGHLARSLYPLATASGSVTTLLPEIKLAVRAQGTTRHSAFDRRSRRHSVLEKSAFAIGDRLGLVLHIAATGSSEQ